MRIPTSNHRSKKLGDRILRPFNSIVDKVGGRPRLRASYLIVVERPSRVLHIIHPCPLS